MSDDDREAPARNDAPEYIGWGSPPEHSRFKKGNVEHLKRRKKPKPDLAAITQEFVTERVPYREGRARKHAARIDVQLLELQRRALAADLTAIAALIDMREDKLLIFESLQQVILWMDLEDADA